MTKADEKFIEIVLKQTLYGLADQFLSNADSNPTSDLKNRTLVEAYSVIDQEVPKIISKLKKHGINSISDITEKSDIMDSVVGEIEQRLEENAKTLSEN